MTQILFDLLKGLLHLILSSALVYVLALWQLYRGFFWGRVTFTHVGVKNHKEFPENYQIVLDTLMDKPANQVWINNPLLMSRTKKAAEKCDLEKPWISLEDNDSWFIRNPIEDTEKILSGVRQQISEHYSRGVVYKSIGRKIEECKFLFCLSSVRTYNDKVRKLRVIIINPELLNDIKENHDKYLIYNQDRKDTVEVLYKIANRWKEEQEGKHEIKVIYPVRLYVPVDDNKCSFQ